MAHQLLLHSHWCARGIKPGAIAVSKRVKAVVRYAQLVAYWPEHFSAVGFRARIAD